MPIGKDKEMKEVKYSPPFRTLKQFEAVRDILMKPEFDFFIEGSETLFNPKETTKKDYQGPVYFYWLDKNKNIILQK